MLSRLRTRRAIFWYLAPDRIVAAVVARSEREPVLEACAASYSPPLAGSCFAPGVLEVAWVLGANRHRHVAALAATFCCMEEVDDEAAEATLRRRGEGRAAEAEGHAGFGRCGAVSGAASVRVRADEHAVVEAASLFRRARLNLAALDCEPCAMASLAEALGIADADAARRQHLSAVVVSADAEGAAEALGDDLAIPVGLAIAWFGSGRAL